MKLVPAMFLGMALATGAVNGQTLSAVPELLILPKGNTFGVVVSCTACDVAGTAETIRASIDDTDFATLQSSSEVVVNGDPFEAVFNVKGENQGGTILRLALIDASGAVLVEASVTIQVTEDIDDDCIFDDLTAAAPDRDGILGVLRNYRDQVLADSWTGRRYTELYYRHSREVNQILGADPELQVDARSLLTHHLADLQSVLAGRVVKLTRKEAAVVDDVLARMEEQAGPQLRRVLGEFRDDLNDQRQTRIIGVEILGGR